MKCLAIPTDMYERFRELLPQHTIKELAEIFGVSTDAVRHAQRTLGLHRPKVWTPERVARLIEMYPDHTNAEIGAELGISYRCIEAKAFKLRLFKSAEFKNEKRAIGMFKKGNIPFNKGRKLADYCSEESIERMKATQFKKGHRPANWKQVGYESSEYRDGYVRVKVVDGPKSFADRYKLKHRLVWEKHFGPIPKGYVVAFKDGDRTNCKIENLELRSYLEHNKKTVQLLPEEYKTLARMKGALKRGINRARNGTSNEMDT